MLHPEFCEASVFYFEQSRSEALFHVTVARKLACGVSIHVTKCSDESAVFEKSQIAVDSAETPREQSVATLGASEVRCLKRAR